MTKLFAGTTHTKFIAAASVFIWTIAIATSAHGVQLQAARVTQVVKDVKVVLEKRHHARSRSAILSAMAPLLALARSRGANWLSTI